MNEHAVEFGPNNGLIGVLCTPQTPSSDDLPCVLILNSGVVHHVGPGRLGVEIARRLAEIGFSSLRFDFSGVGDSAPRYPAVDPKSCGIMDASDAMEFLERTCGVRRFILVGLCSGARHAHYIATADERVAGIISLDGYAFPTAKSQLMKVGAKLEKPVALIAGVSRLFNRIVHTKPTSPTADDGDAFFPKDPTREAMERDLKLQATRNVKMLYIFSGEWDIYRYEGQLKDAFHTVPLKPLLTERRFATADHLYFTRPDRDAMLDYVIRWMCQRFRPQSVDSSPTLVHRSTVRVPVEAETLWLS